jgi:hypothetical protein
MVSFHAASDTLTPPRMAALGAAVRGSLRERVEGRPASREGKGP